MEEWVVEKKGFLHELRNDKLILVLLIVILILGIYVRFSHYNEEGLWNDDMANVPAGLLWFYPHSYFPTLSSGSFPLGNLFIGAGCMLSGQDFSGVSNVSRMFYPGREILIGEPLTKGEWGCHLPMYFFGIIFLFLIAILAFMLLDKYSATFVTAFFAFHPFLLLMSRWIRGDIVFWAFLVASLIFLWKAYNVDKYSRRELLFFVLSFAFLGLAHATKETAPMFTLFAVIILFNKYFSEFLYYIKKFLKSLELKIAEKIDTSNVNVKFFNKTVLFSLLSYLFFFLLPFKLNPRNVYDTYMIYQQFNSEMSTLHFNIFGIFSYLHILFLKINLLDTVLFVIAVSIFLELIIKKGKTKLDKFLIYFSFIGLVLSLFLSIMQVDRLAFPFLIFFIFFMGLSLQKIVSFLSETFKVSSRTLFFILMIAYVIFSFSIALSTSPYFMRTNDAMCLFAKERCDMELSLGLSTLSAKTVANYLEPKLSDNETFYGAGMITHFYIKRSQHSTDWQFDKSFKQQTGREPNIFDRIEYFHPNNENIRYLLANPYDTRSLGVEVNYFKENYSSNDVIQMNGVTVFYVYDLENLKERS